MKKLFSTQIIKRQTEEILVLAEIAEKFNKKKVKGDASERKVKLSMLFFGGKNCRRIFPCANVTRLE